MKIVPVSLVLLLLALPLAAGEPEGSHPAIGQLETRDYLIIVHDSPDGLLYTVKTRDGVIVERELPEDWLATQFPEVYETAVRGIARPPKSAETGDGATRSRADRE